MLRSYSVALLVVLCAFLATTNSSRLGRSNTAAENLLETMEREAEAPLPAVPAGNALQRCRFKCDNHAFLPKDMAANISSEHCYLGCMWFQELGCDPAPPQVPHINQPKLDMIPPKPVVSATTGSTGSTGATGAAATGPVADANAILKKATASATGATNRAQKAIGKKPKLNGKGSSRGQQLKKN